MKGLLIKDFKLMMLQKNFMLIIIAIVIAMMIANDDVVFPAGFLTFAISLFTVTTISYDEFDNGNAFLFTLPVSRKNYVAEKYVLGLLLGCIAWLTATVLGIIATDGTVPVIDLIQSLLILIPIMIVIQAIMIPFQIKFGAEKGRIALVGAFCALAVIAIGIAKGVKAVFNVDLAKVLDDLPPVSMNAFIAVTVITSLMILLISMKISFMIMNRKEF